MTTLADRIPAYEAAARCGTSDDDGSARKAFYRSLLSLPLGHRWGVADVLVEQGLAVLDRDGNGVLS